MLRSLVGSEMCIRDRAGSLGGNGYFLECGLSYADFAVVPVLKVIAAKQSKRGLEGVAVPQALLEWDQRMSKLHGVAELNATGIPILPDSML
eukprot:TRINITY_DN64016_c0_g1_i1.p2 TRINITY_DN64016_c0_g1~~TRINITY_DN64016_c0_g1_i1.p2  ORF type:complete len:101 (+),score=40.96 TRINITY_DN64016_c0_g1_i1:30-305(+)